MMWKVPLKTSPAIQGDSRVLLSLGKEDLPGLQQMYERFLKLGLKVKADVVVAQIQRLELSGGTSPQGFNPLQDVSAPKNRGAKNKASLSPPFS